MQGKLLLLCVIQARQSSEGYVLAGARFSGASVHFKDKQHSYETYRNTDHRPPLGA